MVQAFSGGAAGDDRVLPGGGIGLGDGGGVGVRAATGIPMGAEVVVLGLHVCAALVWG